MWDEVVGQDTSKSILWNIQHMIKIYFGCIDVTRMHSKPLNMGIMMLDCSNFQTGCESNYSKVVSMPPFGLKMFQCSF